MQPIIMQDWITIRGASANPASSVTMSQADWIMTAPFQDITFYLDVREVTGATPAISYETSPARDEALFKLLGAAPINMATGLPTITSFTLAGATVPVSHWTRWKIVGPTSALWDVTFRIMASANSIG